MIQAGISLLVAAVADGLNWAPPLLLLLLLYGGIVVFVVVVAVAAERMQMQICLTDSRINNEASMPRRAFFVDEAKIK